MKIRKAFLNIARYNHYEFSSLRRAKFSTMVLLYQLHRVATGQLTVCCNRCVQQCHTRYHCTVCENFDLCEICYHMQPKHEHKMEHSISLDVEGCNQTSSNSNDTSTANSQLQRRQSMQRCIDSLLHATNCRNAQCILRSCFRYKRVIEHTKTCKGKNNQCNVCKQVIFLSWYHATTCIQQNCQTPFCTKLKMKLRRPRQTQ